ncbi:unnamed protein product [Amoebophrya sp. A120]|nr:unnamed protein product [Amoebophrya sp. A120]|eukprot:GSA120T00000498001.1
MKLLHHQHFLYTSFAEQDAENDPGKPFGSVAPGEAQSAQSVPSHIDVADYNYLSGVEKGFAGNRNGIPTYSAIRPDQLDQLNRRAQHSHELVVRDLRKLRAVVADSFEQEQIIRMAKKKADYFLKFAKLQARKQDAITTLARRLIGMKEQVEEAEAAMVPGGEESASGSPEDRGILDEEALKEEEKQLEFEIQDLRTVPKPEPPPLDLLKAHTLDTFFR